MRDLVLGNWEHLVMGSDLCMDPLVFQQRCIILFKENIIQSSPLLLLEEGGTDNDFDDGFSSLALRNVLLGEKWGCDGVSTQINLLT